jgi:beta-lactamase regulating signal transducer with metallopeptidase domain
METISNWFLFLLVNSAWQMTTIVLVSIVCDRFFHGMPARFRHMLWVTALLLCVGVPIVGSFGFASRTNSNLEAAATEDVQTTAALSSPNASETVVSQPGWSMIPVNEAVVVVLFGVIAIFFSFRMFRLILGFIRMSRVRRTAFAGNWSETDARLIEDCKARYGVGNVEILCSMIVSSPLTLGALRPVIVLPESMLYGSDRNTLIAAISHELNHVRRRDYLKNLFYELIYLPISFHPAATLVKRRIRETREFACDEYVTDTMVEPADYARSLVSIAGMAMDLGRTANITIGILDDGVLEKRIMKILNRPKITTFRRNLLLGSSTFVLALAIIAAMSFSLTPVIAQQKSVPDVETDRSKKEADERLKKMVEELRNPSPKTEEAIKKVKETLERPRLDGDGNWVSLGVSKAVLEEFAAKREAEREAELLNRADLAQNMNISMANSIDIATAQQPGTVLETKLVFERNGGETEEPFYVVTIVVEKDGLKSEKRVIVSGIDGSVGGPRNN